VLRGDANTDGTLDLADPVRILDHLFLGRPLGCEALVNIAADVNDSGSVQIDDGIALLNFLFLGGPPPAAPFPDCTEPGAVDDTGCRQSGCTR
jgi:hypothetical protein